MTLVSEWSIQEPSQACRTTHILIEYYTTTRPGFRRLEHEAIANADSFMASSNGALLASVKRPGVQTRRGQDEETRRDKADGRRHRQRQGLPAGGVLVVVISTFGQWRRPITALGVCSVNFEALIIISNRIALYRCICLCDSVLSVMANDRPIGQGRRVGNEATFRDAQASRGLRVLQVGKCCESARGGRLIAALRQGLSWLFQASPFLGSSPW